MAIKILIADDDKVFLRMMTKMITKKGYEIITAFNGVEALEAIRTQAPDVIILDILMPNMGGYAVLETIRKEPPTEKWQPVIMISGHQELEDLQKAYTMRADHYIPKPCAPQDIEKVVELMVRLIPRRQKGASGLDFDED